MNILYENNSYKFILLKVYAKWVYKNKLTGQPGKPISPIPPTPPGGPAAPGGPVLPRRPRWPFSPCIEIMNRIIFNLT